MQVINDFMARVIARIQSGRDEEGQTLVEYGLIVALLSIAAIAILGLLGDEVVNVFTEVKDSLAGATT